MVEFRDFWSSTTSERDTLSLLFQPIRIYPPQPWASKQAGKFTTTSAFHFWVSSMRNPTHPSKKPTAE